MQLKDGNKNIQLQAQLGNNGSEKNKEPLAIYFFVGCKEKFPITKNANTDSLPYSKSITLTPLKEKKEQPREII